MDFLSSTHLIKIEKQSSHKNGEVSVGTYTTQGLGSSRARCQRLIINHVNKNGEMPIGYAARGQGPLRANRQRLIINHLKK